METIIKQIVLQLRDAGVVVVKHGEGWIVNNKYYTSVQLIMQF